MFQLVDDLLDFTGRSRALGKPIGGDLREGKITLPIIHLLQHGGPEADALIREVVAIATSRPTTGRDSGAAGRASLDRLRLRARGRVRREPPSVICALFPDSQEREALMALADYVLCATADPKIRGATEGHGGIGARQSESPSDHHRRFRIPSFPVSRVSVACYMD